MEHQEHRAFQARTEFPGQMARVAQAEMQEPAGHRVLTARRVRVELVAPQARPE